MGKLISERNELIAKQFQKGVSFEELTKEYDIGFTYLRTILRESGLIKKKPRQNLNARNNKILKMFKAGNTPEAIAVSMKLTVTRIRQILSTDYTKAIRDKELLVAKEKAIKLIAAGKNVKEIQDIIGLQAVNRLKYRFNFNVFKLVVQRRAERSTELYKEGVKTADISKQLGCTEDYVFKLLREAGVKLNLFNDAKRERDKSIHTFIKKGGTLAQAAKKWNLSEATVRIILKK